MDRRQMCIANVQYKKPTANESKRTKRLLRYLTYRESRDEAARHAAGRERQIAGREGLDRRWCSCPL